MYVNVDTNVIERYKHKQICISFLQLRPEQNKMDTQNDGLRKGISIKTLLVGPIYVKTEGTHKHIYIIHNVNEILMTSLH